MKNISIIAAAALAIISCAQPQNQTDNFKGTVITINDSTSTFLAEGRIPVINPVCRSDQGP